MICSRIAAFGTTGILVCDGRCDKAWGYDQRPHIKVSDEDIEYLADDELGTAPPDPGTVQGDDSKPQNENEYHNAWCERYCERSIMVQEKEAFQIRDWSIRRTYKHYWKHRFNEQKKRTLGLTP
jgi:hypothetical protein